MSQGLTVGSCENGIGDSISILILGNHRFQNFWKGTHVKMESDSIPTPIFWKHFRLRVISNYFILVFRLFLNAFKQFWWLWEMTTVTDSIPIPFSHEFPFKNFGIGDSLESESK